MQSDRECVIVGQVADCTTVIQCLSYPLPPSPKQFCQQCMPLSSLGVPTNIYRRIAASLHSALKQSLAQLIVHKCWYPLAVCMALQHRDPLSELTILHRRLCTMELGCFEYMGFQHIMLNKPLTSMFACYNSKTLYIYIYSRFDHETDVVVRFKLEVMVAVSYNILFTVCHLRSFTEQTKLCFEVQSVLYQ